jgi:hypothetical protein
MKAFLLDVREAVLRAINNTSLPNSLVAAAGDEIPSLGTIASWWAHYVDDDIMREVRAAFSRVLNRWSDAGYDVDSPALEGAREYLTKVRDRLVKGTYFNVTVYEDSFEKIRVALAQSIAEGWTREKLAQHIAMELSWEKNGPYWRSVREGIDSQMDEILDELGEPGTPAREHARLHDSRIQSLRDARNIAIKHLDDEYSLWRDRSMLIARTESTGVANYGAFEALTAEGVATKVWISTGDSRTRPTHSAADGQETNMQGTFAVGLARLRFPGDPSGPIGEIANCRCAMVGGENVEGFL